MNQKLIAISACLLTLGCTHAVDPPVVEEELIHDSEAPIIDTDTGSLLPSEVVLPGWIVSIGKSSAPITLVVFTEHHCKYCQEFHEEHLPKLSTDFIDKDLLKVQIVPFSLRKYENSATAAKAALCAAEQGKGLDMHTRLFQDDYKDFKSVNNIANELELDSTTFMECMENEINDEVLGLQREWAKVWEIDLVPTFLLNGEKQVGLPYYEDLRGQIEDMLQ